MKNQYFGDVSDLVKYAVLRTLVDPDQITGAICWMLTADDTRSDGRHTTYLGQPARYRNIDPAVFDALKVAVASGRRDVALARELGLVPGSVFIEELLADNEWSRRAYFTELWQTIRGRNLVFFDPDNGLDVPSVVRGRKHSAKFLYLDELTHAFYREHSIVLYQHYPRVARDEYIQRLRTRILDHVRVTPWFLRASRVVLVIIPQDRDKDVLASRIERAAPRWAPHVRVEWS